MISLQRWTTTVLMITLAGCGSLYRVRKFNPASPNGIPFYLKQGACVQKTVYGVPYSRLTLKVTGSSGVLSSDALTVSEEARPSQDFQTLLDQLDRAQPDTDSVFSAWKQLKLSSHFDPYRETTGRILLGNITSVATNVDYGTVYALNQKKPLAGTVSGNYKIASDGTLTEVQAQTEDKTLATFLTALPISDLVKSAAGIATKIGVAANGQTTPVKFELLQQQRFIRFTYSQARAFSQNCPVGKALEITDSGVSAEVADSDAITSGAADTATKTDDSIKLNGTISIPKSLLNSQPTTGDKPSATVASTDKTTKQKK